MRLASLDNDSRDGELVIVHRSAQIYVSARDIAPTLQAALDDWERLKPALEARSAALHAGTHPGTDLDVRQLLAPLPRAYEWIDGSAYINHIRLVRRARGAEPPETLTTEPLVYQGGSGTLLSATEDLVLGDPNWGLDFEAEVCVVLGDTPQRTFASDAGQYIRLLLLANDVTLRNLVPNELKKGFGFFVSKPATAFSPFAITPDELGGAWRDGRVHLKLRSLYNGQLIGDPEAGPEMHFSFFDLIEHITQTRAFTAGTLLGSGTVSNQDPARGVSCLAERRTRETLEHGAPQTPFMKPGDRIAIEMLDDDGRNLFGTIDQRVVMA